MYQYTAICDDLTLSNGMITYSPNNRLEVTVATHICNDGFTLDDPVARTCQNDRSWSGEVATCKGIILVN